MAQADARHRVLVGKDPGGLDGVGHHGRVAGAVGQKYGVGRKLVHLLVGAVRGHDQHVKALSRQKAQNVPFYSEVVDHEPGAIAGPGKGLQVHVLGGGAGPAVGDLGAHSVGQVQALHAGQGLGPGREPGRVELAGGDEPAHGAMDAQVAGQGAGVDALDAHDPGGVSA